MSVAEEGQITTARGEDVSPVEPAPPEPAQPEPTQPEPAQPEPGGAITLDSEGELNIPDSFWDGLGVAKDEPGGGETKTEPAPETASQAPACYTPEEFAAAFADGTIDEAKLAPDVAAFYKAAMSRAREAQNTQNAPRAPQPQAAPTPPPSAPMMMSREQYAQFTEAAKKVACANFLGIDPREFDEYNAEHTQARNFAMQEIRARASEIASARQAQAARAQALAAEIGELDAEYQRKDPEFFAKHETIMRDYLDRMPHRAAAEALRAIQAGDAAGIRKFVGEVYGDYKKSAGGGAAAPKQPASPPGVVSARAPDAAGGDERSGGGFDVSKLGEMTPEQQAEFFVKNKFVE
jgi:hypothetical protein